MPLGMVRKTQNSSRPAVFSVLAAKPPSKLYGPIYKKIMLTGGAGFLGTLAAIAAAFKAATGFEPGLQKTIEWYKSVYSEKARSL
jgi:hypothetical protein